MMTMRKLRPEEAGLAKQLWLDAFPEDADGFCDFYFANGYPNDTYYGLFEGAQLCSMIGVAEEKIYLFDKAVPMPLLRGVATYHRLQGKGYAGKLTAYVLQQLKAQGYGAALLKTFIHPFYERHGFETCSHRGVAALPAKAGEAEFVLYRDMQHIGDDLIEALLRCYNAYCKGKQLFLVRRPRHMRYLLQEAIGLYGGVLAVHMQEGQAVGYLVGYFQEDGSLYADEAVCGGAGAQVFAQAAAQLGCSTVRYKTFDTDGAPDAMIRVLDMQQWFAHRPAKAQFTVTVEDPLFADNTGCWHIGEYIQKERTQMQSGKTPGQAAAMLLQHGGRPMGIFEEY